MLLAVGESTLLGISALIAAIGGILSTIIGARRAGKEAREKAEEECRVRLREARKEAEELAAELHELKMRLAADDAD